MKNYFRTSISDTGLVLLLAFCIAACTEKKKNSNTQIQDVAGNEEVLNFMKTFDGRGALSNSSQPLTAVNAVKAFRVADDLAIDLVLSDPQVSQPVFMNFDHRGRLWVVQYSQYPYPAGLKVMRMDQHIRAKFDMDPLPRLKVQRCGQDHHF